MDNRINLSIVIPVYNEEDNVDILYNEIVRSLPDEQFNFEVVFVDDGSTDRTLSCLQSKAQTSPRLRVVAHKHNAGQSAALVSGVRAARFNLIATLDGDGQNDPADIPRLITCIKDNRTVILGNRARRDDNRLRRISSRVGNGVRRRLLNDDCPDTGCSLKIFPREAFLNLPHFNHLHRFLPALFKRDGYQLINVAVNHRPRWHGLSKYGVMNRLFVGIHDLIGVRWLLKRPCAPEIISNE